MSDKLLEEIRDLLKTRSSTNSWGSQTNLSSTDPLAGLKSSMKPTQGAFENLGNVITTNLDVWRKLSGVGANFSNDIIRMSVAAKEARVELTEFADIISQNAVSFAGLGGSVTRGVEAFAKLTKEFQDSTFNRDLLNLGLTAKETNEMLALQIGFQKRINIEDETQRKLTFDATRSLAVEMDFLAKVTGKSRDLQEKELRDQQRKGEVEAKFRLIGLEKGAAAEQEARRRYAEQYAQAAARGQGELFEDMFTKGVPASEEAATQLALMGRAGAATAESAKALANANFEAADAANKRATVETAALQNNKTFLTLGALGPKLAGTAGEIAKTSVQVNDALFQSVKKVAETNGILLKSQQDYASALKIIRDEVVASQAGFDKAGEAGKKVSGATEGLIAFEKGMKDAQAGLYGAMEVANSSGKTIADSLRNIGSEISQGVKDLGNIRERMVTDAQKALLTQGKEGTLFGGGAYLAQRGMENLIETPARAAIRTTANALKPDNAPVPANIPQRNEGSLGATGKLFENWGSGTLVELHGMESVMRPEDLEKLVNSTIGGINKSIKSGAKDTAGSLNLSDISKKISTTISSVVSSPSTIQQPKLKQDLELDNITKQFKDLSKAADMDKELDNITQQFEDLSKAADMDKELDNITQKFTALSKEAEMDKELDSITQQFKQLAKEAEMDKELESVTEQFKKLSKEVKNTNGAVAKEDPFKTKGIIKDGKLNLNMFDVPGLSGFGTALKPTAEPKPENNQQAKQSTKEAGKTNEPTTDQAVATTEAQKREAARQRSVQQGANTTQTTSPEQKKATLDDVVSSLNRLNTQMSRLINQQSDLLTKQIRTTRDSSSSNFYDRMTP